CPHPAGREFHRFDDLGIGGAAAKVAGKVVPDLIIVRVRMLLEELARHQHEARRTEAALGRARFQERLLHRAQLAVDRKALDRRDRFACGECREIEAARDGGAVDEHGAAAAQPLRAAFASAVEIEPVAQKLDDRLMRRNRRGHLLAIEGEMDAAGHVKYSEMGAWATAAPVAAPSPLPGEGSTGRSTSTVG